MTRRTRASTSTSNFGSGARESHDASAFYDRFRPPDLSTDDTVLAPTAVEEPFVVGDARRMDSVAAGSVALVVTSPPYFAGKQYEEELHREGVPSSYLEFLQMLREVFAECVAKLEPGGRIAVNVANLGRKPYRSLSADVIRILEHDLGLLLRGELIWQKGQGAGGSCAWGSFRGAANPVLRDITERIVVASKGRFDRARSPARRRADGLPHLSTSTTDDFLASTLDVWSIPTESATRVKHPAPFPVELPEQLIQLYTYRDDLVLDPFLGSGSTAVAAARLQRRFVGYDLDPAYVQVARERVSALNPPAQLTWTPARSEPTQGSAIRIAEAALAAAGFTVTDRKRRVRGTGVTVAFAARDGVGGEWLFDVAGTNTTRRGGMLQNDVVWRTLGRAHALRGRAGPRVPFVVLTTNLPKAASEGANALRSAGPEAFFDAIDLLSTTALERLRRYAAGGSDRAEPGFWTSNDLVR